MPGTYPTTEKSDFAVLGHQECWENVYPFIHQVRDAKLRAIPEEDIKYLFPYFPPRSIFRITVHSIQPDKQICGHYIETFLPPDRLDTAFSKENLLKVSEAAICADKLQVPVATLGGFTSIILEGQLSLLPAGLQTQFTTGNSLTAAFIVQSLQDACALLHKDISQSHLLIIGATGDIGSACAGYFLEKAAKLTLAARNRRRLYELSTKLSKCTVQPADSVEESAAEADIIIAVASATNVKLPHVKPGAIIVDAGFPKNIDATVLDLRNVHLYFGGMGYVRGGYSFSPDYKQTLYHFPEEKIAHGCVLEAAVLAFENKRESFSQGRGHITSEKMDQISTWARKHGIVPAPFYNHQGLWQIQTKRYDDN